MVLSRCWRDRVTHLGRHSSLFEASRSLSHQFADNGQSYPIHRPVSLSIGFDAQESRCGYQDPGLVGRVALIPKPMPSTNHISQCVSERSHARDAQSRGFSNFQSHFVGGHELRPCGKEAKEFEGFCEPPAEAVWGKATRRTSTHRSDVDQHRSVGDGDMR